MSAEIWVKVRADKFLRHGGKTSRRATIRRLIAILNDIQRHERVNSPEVVGRAHVHRYYERHSHLAVSTQRDHYYAVKLLWQWLERTGQPPKPKSLTSEMVSL